MRSDHVPKFYVGPNPFSQGPTQRIVLLPETTPHMQAREDPMPRDYNQPSPHTTQSLLPRGRILLVDEDEEDLTYGSTLLQSMGYLVRAFNNYREAEVWLGHERFDFVIVSQGSPAFETRTLVEHALARNRHTPVVVLTRCLEMSCYLEAMQLGAVDYLEKPMAPAEVERLVATHCLPQQGDFAACQV
jgi:CheY-like chemotaxis protein